MDGRIKTYLEFYQFYLSEYSNPMCRFLYFVGTGLVIILAIVFSVYSLWKYWWILPIVGYGFAWMGHFFFEKNKPATFKYPI